MLIKSINPLPCLDARKSFYGKASLCYTPDGDRVLCSYTTFICSVSPDLKLTKLDPTATATTRRHIRSFLTYLGLPALTSREWDALPLHKPVTLSAAGEGSGV